MFEHNLDGIVAEDALVSAYLPGLRIPLDDLFSRETNGSRLLPAWRRRAQARHGREHRHVDIE